MKRIIIDSHVRIDINLGYSSSRDPEVQAKRLEYAAKDVKEFMRDHRSMDIHDVYVVREYGWKCEHCGRVEEIEKEPEQPECCEAAIREWATQEQLIDFGYEEAQ